MKTTRHLIATIGMIALLLCILNVTAFAQGATETARFPEGVIEVPQGTAISIDDDAGTVAITDMPVEISEGDTFIVYLQDLPIGYIANAVSTEGDNTIISVEKAGKAIYAIDDEEGTVELTPDICEFIPAEGVTIVQNAAMKSQGVGLGDALSYENGTLKLQKSYGSNTVVVSLSNMRLKHSVSNGNLSLALQGNWNINTPVLSTSEDILEDIPLVSIRIAGIGKITLKLSMTMSLNMTCDYSGTFSVGFNTVDGEAGNANSSFTVSNKTVSGKGKIEGALKITGGVDILFAAADLYGEIGIGTDVQTQSKTNTSTHETVYCENYRFYLFLRAGVEAEFKAPKTEIKKNFKGSDFGLPEEPNLTRHYDIHFENGKLVSSCTQGMSIHENHAYDGGFESSFGSTLFTDGRERVLETSVDLPWDLEIDGDYRIANGNLNLNGNTLIINGDLIQSGGTLTIGSGTLIVHGDYRLQGLTDGEYGDSEGSLNMSNSEGIMTVDGDVVIQTNSTSSKMNSGTLNIRGNLYQKNAEKNDGNLKSGSGLDIVMTSDNAHTIRLESPYKNFIGQLSVNNDLYIPDSLCIGSTIEESSSFASNSGLVLCGGVVNANAGIIHVNGNLYHFKGMLLVNSGIVDISGNYYMVGESSNIEAGQYHMCQAVLNMKNEQGIVRVLGSFVTSSLQDKQDHLTAGTLYVGGDFIQKPNGSSGYDLSTKFLAQEGHRTVLNGTGKQTVYFASSSSHFGTLETTNTNLVFECYTNWLKLGCDVTASTTGFWPNSNITLSEHKLTIEGNLLHSQGTITINDGELDITGNYYMVGESSNIEAGQYHMCQAVLNMKNEQGIVRVLGSFVTSSLQDKQDHLTAGTLYVGGDFIQKPNGSSGYDLSTKFLAQEGHKTVLNGTGKQTIHFDSSSSRFGTLETTKPMKMYEFNRTPCWITLIQPDIPEYGTPDFVLPAAIVKIEESAFYGIAASIVYVPDNCEGIGAYAFKDAAVTQIRIPQNCSIDDTAFEGCELVYIFGTPGSAAETFCETHDNCFFVEEYQY